MRVGLYRTSTILAALIGLYLGACTYSSLYFVRVDTEETRLDRFRLLPRVFAYKEEKGTLEGLRGNRYSVTVRVDDPTTEIEEYDWRLDPSTVDSLADAFFDQVSDVFVADSLVLHPLPAASGRILLKPDRVNHAPRHQDYFTLKFGNTDIARQTETLRVVLHVTRAGSPALADSVVWLMHRVEKEGRGLAAFRENVEGYR
jgi:hypothetical protein